MAPTLPHCVPSLPPKGAQPAFGRPGDGLMAPTLPHCVSSLPPKGAQPAFGRPGDGLMAPTRTPCVPSPPPKAAPLPYPHLTRPTTCMMLCLLFAVSINK